MELAYGAWAHAHEFPPTMINYDRCVWVVTVAAPFLPSHRSYGSTFAVSRAYTVVLDAGSHDLMGISGAQ